MVVLYHTDFCRAFEHSSAVVAAVAAAVDGVVVVVEAVAAVEEDSDIAEGGLQLRIMVGPYRQFEG